MLQESLTLPINRKLRCQYLWNLSTGIAVCVEFWPQKYVVLRKPEIEERTRTRI